MLAVSVGLILGAVILFWVSTFKVPTTDSIRERRVIESTKIYDRTGEILLYDTGGNVRRSIVPIEDISRHMKNATIAIEDKEFYNNYLKRAKAFLDLLGSDINQRLDTIEGLIGVRTGGQKQVRLARRIIEIWQGMVRDLILINFGQKNLIQHNILNKELEQKSKNLNLKDLVNLNYVLVQSVEFVKANVNPKLVLENISWSIN